MAADTPAELYVSPEVLDAAIRAFNRRRPKRSRLPKRSPAMEHAVRAAIREWFAFSAARRAGWQLANCAFNLSQSPALDESARRSLKESQTAWDAATQGGNYR